MKPRLGMKAKDKITGFEGTVTGYVEYISGCNQVLLTPSVDDKGAARDSGWFDVQRIEQVGSEVLVLDNGDTPGCDMPAPVR